MGRQTTPTLNQTEKMQSEKLFCAFIVQSQSFLGLWFFVTNGGFGTRWNKRKSICQGTWGSLVWLLLLFMGQRGQRMRTCKKLISFPICLSMTGKMIPIRWATFQQKGRIVTERIPIRSPITVLILIYE